LSQPLSKTLSKKADATKVSSKISFYLAFGTGSNYLRSVQVNGALRQDKKLTSSSPNFSTDPFQGPVLPHKCGVPPGLGTPQYFLIQMARPRFGRHVLGTGSISYENLKIPRASAKYQQYVALLHPG
jgi:hypothetical protein